ncbi:YdiU family protein [Fertoebacter nigrum]|uniref:Protein nucleotidyltransferase YdiU n=1 Tax=Fertoeibacter niger TaxID=2656921 RepID=A0A8X8KN66_9RHOB|nr:YdiU family protein [Fertoeibacter niger]NUB43710.1 YdiU family protein [Fertoeibacter niger]
MTLPASAVPLPAFGFDNSYARDLPGFYVDWQAAEAPAPRLLRLNHALAAELGLDPAALEPVAAGVFSGNLLPTGAHPLAQVYAGHQFGGFSPQLGDGRALLLGEVIDRNGARRDIQLKGSGRTPFSRSGDGKAAIGPVLREYLIGEAMHALGVPTTRALAAVTTGQSILRDTGPLPGAVLTRVAASHIRVGTFQYFAARGEVAKLRQLADYSMARHYPALEQGDYLGFFRAVAGAQARLVAQWMGLGFIHGVMNTDNVAISGETIDYGPCAFMEAYAPGTVFSSIDSGGRYAYANQPLLLGWNMARFAEALLPLLDADEDRAVALATEALGDLMPAYESAWLAVMRAKLGLAGEDAGDAALAQGLLAAMDGQAADWTLTFRRLATAVGGDAGLLRPLFADATALDDWLPRWRARLAPGAGQAMNAVNPACIPRNHRVEEALAAAQHGDMGPFETLLSVLATPFTDQPGREGYALPAPAGFGRYRTFCGT